MSKINISLDELIESGAHFGHQTKRWNPKMEPYLYGQEEGVHIFDLTKTKPLIEEALNFLAKSAKDGKNILLLGTKKQIKDKVAEIAKDVGIPYVNERWLGGTISNFNQIKKSIDRMQDLKADLASGVYNKYTKKERLLIDREIDRLDKYFGGIAGLTKIPDVLIVIDTKREHAAIHEASTKGVPIVGIVDSNSDPDPIDYPIPMNDDASKALEYILDLIAKAISQK